MKTSKFRVIIEIKDALIYAIDESYTNERDIKSIIITKLD